MTNTRLARTFPRATAVASLARTGWGRRLMLKLPVSMAGALLSVRNKTGMVQFYVARRRRSGVGKKAAVAGGALAAGAAGYIVKARLG